MATETPRDDERTLAALSRILLGMVLLLLVAVALGIPATRHRFAAIFDDFGTELPRTTKVMMVIPDAVFPVLAVVAGIGLCAVQRSARPKTAAIVYAWASAVCLAVAAAYVVALFLPLTTLMTKLSS